jgi:hypothetical protein
MENTIKVEFTVKMDKTIYENSPWKTREEFLYIVILNHMDADLGIHKGFAEKMESPKKENYETFIKCLEGMKDSVNKSIKHEVVNVHENIEEVKVSFSFKYYETPTVTAERTVEGFIFVTPLSEVTTAIEDIERAKKIPGKVPEDKKEQVENAIKMFTHAINFMEEAKSSLIVTKDGVDLGNIFEATKQKPKM